VACAPTAAHAQQQSKPNILAHLERRHRLA
jgi:hypothetical protein